MCLAVEKGFFAIACKLWSNQWSTTLNYPNTKPHKSISSSSPANFEQKSSLRPADEYKQIRSSELSLLSIKTPEVELISQSQGYSQG